MLVITQVNVLYLLPDWLGKMASHPLVKTHPDRSSLTLIVYGTPYVPFKYKRRIRSVGFRDVIYGKMTVVYFCSMGVFRRRRLLSANRDLSAAATSASLPNSVIADDAGKKRSSWPQGSDANKTEISRQGPKLRPTMPTVNSITT